jgi:hypothetical protein
VVDEVGKVRLGRRLNSKSQGVAKGGRPSAAVAEEIPRGGSSCEMLESGRAQRRWIPVTECGLAGQVPIFLLQVAPGDGYSLQEKSIVST